MSGKVKSQGPCPCGVSSDAFTYYEDGGYHCFSCNDKNLTKRHHAELGDKKKGGMVTEKKKVYTKWDAGENWKNGRIEALLSRGITEDTAKHFGVKTHRDDLGQATHWMLPFYDREGNPCAYKRKGIEESDYMMHGEKKDRCTLFGQNVASGGRKFVTVTEGEMDAMAVYQMTKNHKNPSPIVVSLINGANSVEANLQKPEIFAFLDSFEEVRLCMDNDKHGREAGRKLIEILGHRKCKIIKKDPRYKDANDYLLAGKGSEYTSQWWAAEHYRPTAIQSFAQAWDAAKARKNLQCYTYPWPKLQDKTYGARAGEMVVINAQTGVGKTQTCRTLQKHFYDTTEENIAGMYIEEPTAVSAMAMVGMYVQAPIHLPGALYDEAEADRIAKKMTEEQRLFFYDDFGANNVKNIMSKIKFFVNSLGCKFIILDHISMLASDHSDTDERQVLDEAATALKKSTLEWDYNLHVVAHQNREGKIHGTSQIEKLADIIININRDLEADCVVQRNTTESKVTKNRFSGDTGPTDSVRYDRDTTLQIPVEEESEQEF